MASACSHLGKELLRAPWLGDVASRATMSSGSLVLQVAEIWLRRIFLSVIL